MSTTSTTLLSSVSAAGAGSSHDLTAEPRYPGGGHAAQISGSFTATVAVEGSVDGSTWHSLGSLSAPGLITFTGAFSSLRGNVTSYTSGSITLDVRYGLSDNADTQTLLARLTSTRAAHLDTLVGRLTSSRATKLDNLVRLDANVSSVDGEADIKGIIRTLRAGGVP